MKEGRHTQSHAADAPLQHSKLLAPLIFQVPPPPKRPNGLGLGFSVGHSQGILSRADRSWDNVLSTNVPADKVQEISRISGNQWQHCRASLPYTIVTHHAKHRGLGRSKFRRCMRAAAIESESRRRSGDCGVPPHTMSPTNPIVMDSFNPLTIHSLLLLPVSSMDGAGSVTNILLLEGSSYPRSRSLQAHTYTHKSDSSELNQQTEQR